VATEWLLRQNSELRREGIWNWSLPAWAGRLADGRTYNTCPEAQACVKLCYARTGTYRFRGVLAAHERNLTMLMDDMPAWEARMTQELTHRRYAAGAHIRIHDSGDFYSDDYVAAWLRIIRATPAVTFYAYTKSIDRFRRLVEPDPPANFLWVYSLGGKEDHLIDRETDRHADVFTDDAAMEAAGYSSQEESDLLAVYGPPKVGIPANNIRHLRKKQGGETFGSLQRQADDRARARRRRGPGKQYDAGRP
jgi:hypothetical protein